MASSRAKNTMKAYDAAWKAFARWCAETQLLSFPATADTVSLFITWCIYAKHYRLNTVRSCLAAIRFKHIAEKLPSPVTPEIRKLVANAARELRERPGGKAALTAPHLQQMSSALDDGRTISTRDRAMILVGFGAGWRRSELVSLSLTDAEFTADGILLTLGASKTDQDGARRRFAGVAYGENPLTCPVRALQAWLAVRGDWPGPLFCRVNRYGQVVHKGLKGDTINDRIKTALHLIGVESNTFGAHSLRAGMITAASEAGASELAIMQATGIHNMSTLLRYIRPAKAFRSNPLRGVL